MPLQMKFLLRYCKDYAKPKYLLSDKQSSPTLTQTLVERASYSYGEVLLIDEDSNT